LFGAIPGLSATLGIALLTALTFNMTSGQDPALAIQYSMLSLIGIYVGAVYGGSHPSILLNIPGTAASAATALEGYPLSLKGKGGETVSLATMMSFLGTLCGVLAMLFIIPLLLKLATNFTSIEYFLLALFGVIICGSLSSKDLPLKGWIAGLLGLAIAMVGESPLQAYSRFTFGISELRDGIKPISIILGGFVMPQVIRNIIKPVIIKDRAVKFLKIFPDWRVIKKHSGTAVRSGFIGVGIGSIPGIGEDVAAWVSYNFSKKLSKTPEKYGKGSTEGLVASETANNACIGGALVPLLTLGIPGSPPAAMLLSAIYLHNITPGPMVMQEQPTFIPMMCAILFLASFAMLFCGLLMARVSVYLLKIPSGLLMAMVTLFAILGSYSLDNSMTNVYVMVLFGIVAYFLEETGYPMAPLVIGVVLGPMVDENLRQALMVHHGNVLPFITRPISLVLLFLISLTFLSSTNFYKNKKDSFFRRFKK